MAGTLADVLVMHKQEQGSSRGGRVTEIPRNDGEGEPRSLMRESMIFVEAAVSAAIIGLQATRLPLQSGHARSISTTSP